MGYHVLKIRETVNMNNQPCYQKTIKFYFTKGASSLYFIHFSRCRSVSDRWWELSVVELRKEWCRCWFDDFFSKLVWILWLSWLIWFYLKDILRGWGFDEDFRLENWGEIGVFVVKCRIWMDFGDFWENCASFLKKNVKVSTWNCYL